MATAIPDLYDFLRGPGFVISIVVFLSGFTYRTIWLVLATRKISRVNLQTENIVSGRSIPAQRSFLKNTTSSIKIKIRNTIFGTNPLMGITSLIFHILLFITPVFLFAHNTVADLTIGISLPALPEHLTDFFTMILITFGVFFLARRIFLPRVRVLSTLRDYTILFIVMAPFISGFFAYHHFFNYQTVIFTHMIIGELAIMIVPFTSLIHMPFIIFSRFFIDSEYSITPGSRRW